MAAIIKLKRRLGSSGAPASLKSGEPAYNENDGILYYGAGNDGNGNATSVTAIAGPGVVYTKTQIDAALQGLKIKSTAQWATAAVLPNSPTYSNGSSGVGATLTAGANAAIAVDGGSPALNDLVLVKNQSSALQNGLYKVTTVGSGAAPWVLTRSTEMDLATEFSGAFVPVGAGGTANANTLWLCNPSGTVTVGTTSIPFTQLANVTVINDLTTGGTGVSLSAQQGVALKALVDAKVATSAIVNDLTTGGAAVPLSAEQGKVLATQQTIVTKTASATLALGEAGCIIEMNVGTANTLTVPPNSSVAFPINTRIDISQYGAGVCTITAGAGVTIRSAGGKLKTGGQYSGATLYKRGTDEWVLMGDIAS